MVKVGSEGSTGPAGMLRGVHRDFLLLLMYYPYKDGCVCSHGNVYLEYAPAL
jgi:hypothetical protein